MDGKDPRPRNRERLGDGMKVHLRVRRVGARTFRLLTLRPQTRVAFSTNFFHGTHHVLSSFRGGRLLAHLLWGLSYQRKPGTLFVLRGPHVWPTPFDADPSMPIALVPTHLTELEHDSARAVRRALDRPSPSDRTVRWKSHGAKPWGPDEYPDRVPPERTLVRGGLLCIEGSPAAFRVCARYLLGLSPGRDLPSDHHYLGDGSCLHLEGEVQLFSHYERMCAVARVARSRVLASKLANGPEPEAAQRLRERVWRESTVVRAERRRTWRRLT